MEKRSLLTRPANASSYKYTLLRFNTIGIPAGSIIRSATLGLDVQSQRSSNHLDRIYRLKTAWTEGTLTGNTCSDGATWNAPNCTDSWGAGGAAFSSANYDATLLGTIAPKTKGYKTVDVAPAVDAWVNGGQPNDWPRARLYRHRWR